MSPELPHNHRLYIETVGCQMNMLDSELVVAALRKQGYELTADVGVNRTSIANWPRPPDLTTHVCQRRSLGQVSLVHPDLGNDAKWSLLTDFDFGSAPPADCAGVELQMGDIGSIFNPPSTALTGRKKVLTYSTAETSSDRSEPSVGSRPASSRAESTAVALAF